MALLLHKLRFVLLGSVFVCLSALLIPPALSGSARQSTLHPESPWFDDRWYGIEYADHDQQTAFRWTKPRFQLDTPNPGGMLVAIARWAGGPNRTTTVDLTIDSVRLQVRVSPEPRRYVLLVPPQAQTRLRWTFTVPPLRDPATERQLGVVLFGFSVHGGGMFSVLPSALVVVGALCAFGIFLLVRVPWWGSVLFVELIQLVLASWYAASGWRLMMFDPAVAVLPAIGLAAGSGALLVVSMRHWPIHLEQHRFALGLSVACFLGMVILGVWNLPLGLHPDEADKLGAGHLMANGSVLYRDLFTHHFPLPYYWAAAIIGLVSPSAIWVRLSVLLFQMICLLIMAATLRAPLMIGITAFVWALVAPLYSGHMLLYHSIAGPSIITALVLTLALLARTCGRPLLAAVGIGGMCALALLSNPLMVYPVLVLLAALVLIGRQWRAAGVAAGSLAALVLAQALVLVASGSWNQFVADVWVFNREVYAGYLAIDPAQSVQSIDQILTLIRVFDPRWFQPGTFLEIFSSVPSLTVDRSIMVGFFWCLTLLVSCGWLLWKRRIGSAVFFYLFIAALQARIDEGFHSIPVVLLGCLSLAAILSGFWNRLAVQLPESQWMPVIPFPLRPTPALMHVLRTLFAALFLAFVLRVGWLNMLPPWANRDQLYWGIAEQSAAAVQAQTCGDPRVRLGAYPAEPLYYLFTDLRPVSRYIYFWPWVAQVGQADVIDELARTDAIVLVDQEGDVWGIPNRVFLADLIAFLDQHYVRRSDKMYVSPALAARCPAP